MLCRNQCQSGQALKHKNLKTPVYFCRWFRKSFFLWHVFVFCLQVNLCEMGKPNAAIWKYVYHMPENLHHSLVSKFPHRIQRSSGSISSTTKDSTPCSWVTFNNGRQPVFRSRRSTASLEYIPLQVKYIFAAWWTSASIFLTIHTSGLQRGVVWGVQPPPPQNSEGPPKSCKTQPDCENC